MRKSANIHEENLHIFRTTRHILMKYLGKTFDNIKSYQASGLHTPSKKIIFEKT